MVLAENSSGNGVRPSPPTKTNAAYRCPCLQKPCDKTEPPAWPEVRNVVFSDGSFSAPSSPYTDNDGTPEKGAASLASDRHRWATCR